MAKNKLFTRINDVEQMRRSSVASDPHSLETISTVVEEQEFVLEKLHEIDRVEYKVDYSNFSNFVFFNSALDYFNLTGEKILNEYPYDGSLHDVQLFVNDLDGYQKHVLNVWPKRVGHLRFNTAISSSYVKVEDNGIDGNVEKTALLSPGTGSLSVEAWFEPKGASGSDEIHVLLQKISGSTQSGYTLYLTGSQVRFKVTSGSVSSEVSASCTAGSIQYVACVLDRTTADTFVSIFTGSMAKFPAQVQRASASIVGPIHLGNTNFYIASGTLTGKVTTLYTGSLDDVRVWKSARTAVELSSTFNAKAYAQRTLAGLWRFNESGSITGGNSENSLVIDSSGRKLNGRIQNYFTALRGSGSLYIYEDPDPILFISAPEVRSLVVEQQTSGSDYDKSNDNIITRLTPEHLLTLEQLENSDALEKFLYVIARQFDVIKVAIDQFTNILKMNYGKYDHTPDAMLEEVGKFFGWEFVGNFLDTNVVQYLLGKNVMHDVAANRGLEKKLYEIKNEFWKRTLNNLIYLYKTKGTGESINALLRVYGVDKKFLRLKEYGYRQNVGIATNRINAEKSVHALTFGSASLTASVTSSYFTSVVRTVETRLRFPTTSSAALTGSEISGSIWTVGTSGSTLHQLTYLKATLSSYSGSLIFSSSNGVGVTMSGVGIFDNRWYNVAVLRDSVSGSVKIDVQRLDVDTIDVHLTASALGIVDVTERPHRFTLGASGSFSSQFWTHEVRVWDSVLSDRELEDHALNFQSYGTDDTITDIRNLKLHWRLRENLSASVAGLLPSPVVDYVGTGVTGYGSNFRPNVNPYRKFLMEYNYIAPPDMSWTEEKERVFDANSISGQNLYVDSPVVALEFNMVDALNEDMSQIVSSLEQLNVQIGMPQLKYDVDYFDMAAVRHSYFKLLAGRLNFRVFADMLEFFDRSFIEMVRRLLPSRAIFMGDEFVVESHMLERPKHVWGYARQKKASVIEGGIQMIKRFGK